MTGIGIGQILLYAVLLIALTPPLGAYMARVYRGERRPARALVRLCRARLPAAGRRARRPRAGLEVATRRPCSCSAPSLRRPLRAPAPAGAALPQPGRPAVGLAHDRVQHGDELRHQHELAVLRRRDDDVVPEPDGRARCAELRLRGGRHGGAGGGDSRLLPVGARARLGNFWSDLYRSLAYILLPLSLVLAIVLVARASCRRSQAPRRRPPSRARSSRSPAARPPPGRDQAARHERRRLLQLELGRPVREPERAHELPRDALDPAHPGRR